MNITKKESLSLRGLAITIIVLHNIVHIAQKIQCNESFYCQEFTDRMLANVISMPYSYIISFWGWLGVPLFVFLSGYGMEKNYGGDKHSFIIIRKGVGKLFLLMAPAYMFFWICRILIEYNSSPRLSLGGLFFYGIKGLSQLSFTSNIFYADSIDLGVYWYFGLTAQLYILFALLLRKIGNSSLIIISITSILLLMTLELSDVSTSVVLYLRKQCLGWLTCFALGMITARKVRIIPTTPITLFFLFFLLMLLLIISSITIYTWVLPELLIISIFIVYRKGWFVNNRLWGYIGGISASIFAVHPVLRYLWLRLPISYDNQIMVLVISIAFLLLSIIISVMYDKLYKYLLVRFSPFL